VYGRFAMVFAYVRLDLQKEALGDNADFPCMNNGNSLNVRRAQTSEVKPRVHAAIRQLARELLLPGIFPVAVQFYPARMSI